MGTSNCESLIHLFQYSNYKAYVSCQYFCFERFSCWSMWCVSGKRLSSSFSAFLVAVFYHWGWGEEWRDAGRSSNTGTVKLKISSVSLGLQNRPWNVCCKCLNQTWQFVWIWVNYASAVREVSVSHFQRFEHKMPRWHEDAVEGGSQIKSRSRMVLHDMLDLFVLLWSRVRSG